VFVTQDTPVSDLGENPPYLAIMTVLSTLTSRLGFRSFGMVASDWRFYGTNRFSYQPHIFSFRRTICM